VLLYPTPYGALTQLYCATAPAAADANGRFFIPWAREGKGNVGTEDLRVGEKLWEWLEEQAKKY
jgi:retinol dehydrogenase 12